MNRLSHNLVPAVLQLVTIFLHYAGCLRIFSLALQNLIVIGEYSSAVDAKGVEREPVGILEENEAVSHRK